MECAVSERTTWEGFLLQKRHSSQYPAVQITDIDDADNVAVLESCVDGLQEATTNISHFGKEAGLKISAPKVKTMLSLKFHNQHPYEQTSNTTWSVASRQTRPKADEDLTKSKKERDFQNVMGYLSLNSDQLNGSLHAKTFART